MSFRSLFFMYHLSTAIPFYSTILTINPLPKPDFDAVAKDLSAHLYRSSHREISGKTRLFNWKSWIAWPLPPDKVPRENANGPGNENLQAHFPFIQTPGKLSRPLHDCLQAASLRIAKKLIRPYDETGMLLRKDIPDMAADDEEASALLDPCINHVLHDFDGLLESLHHTRKSYLSLSKSVANKPDDAGTRGRPKRKRDSREQESAFRGHGQYSKQSTSEYEASQASDHSAKKMRRGRPSNVDPYEKFLRRRGGLGLHDWTTVIGLATICTTDQEAVRRTRVRCELLFGDSPHLEVFD